jgi:hypothetical protein
VGSSQVIWRLSYILRADIILCGCLYLFLGTHFGFKVSYLIVGQVHLLAGGIELHLGGQVGKEEGCLSVYWEFSKETN